MSTALPVPVFQPLAALSGSLEQLPKAIKAAAAHGVWASVAIAQAAIETGWGRSELYTKHRNAFGVKWFGPAAGPYPEGVTGSVAYQTTEKPASGTYVTTAHFRTYADVAGSAMDYAANLRATPAYRDAFTAATALR